MKLTLDRIADIRHGLSKACARMGCDITDQEIYYLCDLAVSALAPPAQSGAQGWIPVPREPTRALAAKLMHCHPSRLDSKRLNDAALKWSDYLELIVAEKEK